MRWLVLASATLFDQGCLPRAAFSTGPITPLYGAESCCRYCAQALSIDSSLTTSARAAGNSPWPDWPAEMPVWPCAGSINPQSSVAFCFRLHISATRHHCTITVAITSTVIASGANAKVTCMQQVREGLSKLTKFQVLAPKGAQADGSFKSDRAQRRCCRYC